MKRFLCALCLAFLADVGALAATVTGNAFLDNTGNHATIEIQFIAASPSAVTTSGVTNATGAFSVSVSPGIYNITYIKAGYQSQTIPSVVIAADMVLGTVTLSSTPLIDVSGNVEGTWTANTVYRVIGDISVPASKSLVIESGAEIRFMGFYTFTIDGVLNAQGSPSDPILFTSGNATKARGDWGGIITRTRGVDTTRFNYCTIEYGASNANSSALIWSQGNTVVTHCKIRASAYAGVYNQSTGYLKISDTEISDCYYYGLISGSTATGAVANRCNIHHVDLIGVSNSFTLSEFKNSRVSNTGYNGFQNFGECIIERNIFFNSANGIYVVSGTPLIKNNTILNNTIGIGFYDLAFWHPSAIVTSNIFYQNSSYAIKADGVYGPEKIEYNLFFGSPAWFNLAAPAGFGVILTTNVGGYPADAYYNIFQNPQFITTNATDPNFVRLGASSPALHAGDPQYTFCDGSVVDCGAILVPPCTQTISFGPLANKIFTDPPFDLTAHATSTLTLHYTSSNPLVATVSGNRVSIVGVGETTIEATQPGNDEFLAANPVTQILMVYLGSQVITFALTSKTIGDPVVTLQATATSGLDVQFSTISTRVSIVNNQMTLLQPGRVEITASQPGNQNFNPAANVTQSICINPLPPVISIDTVANQLVLTSSASENLWFRNGEIIPDEESGSLTVTDSGVYTAMTWTDDCLSEMSNNTDLVITGLQEPYGLRKMNVYPNPARNELVLDLMEFDPLQRVDVSVYDMLGRRIESNNGFQGSRLLMNVRSYPQGRYVIQASQGMHVATVSFIKQ